ncbi:MAG: gamma-glutamyltransferase [Candidatus Eisenbacteria bacterium]|uniref:Gamma-glutamyltransferase n=1 Tax=Eiseniibacteriota bacterium TaxID=2212470 RepID=A0A956LV93_UNCEI|nr:gamma-glutamyltransferase [Candidatus Eisenbacteria bacterium]
MMYRPPAVANNGMIVASHPLAVEAGAAMLRAGGHAVDAVIAAAAVLSVVEPSASGLGGDAFFLVHDEPTGKVTALNGSGAAPASLTRERFSGRSTVPLRSSLSCTVPGCVQAWEDAWKRWGRLPWTEVLAPALHHARAGFPISWRMGRIIARYAGDIARDPGLAATYLDPEQMPLQVGQSCHPSALAHTMEELSREGATAFYQGRVAEQLAQGVDRDGGALAGEDLASHRSVFAEPYRLEQGELTVFEQPLPSQGMLLLIMLGLVSEGRPDPGVDTFEELHRQIESKKIAFALKEAFFADPKRLPVPEGQLVEALLDPVTLRRLARVLEQEPLAVALANPVVADALSEVERGRSLVEAYRSAGFDPADPPTPGDGATDTTYLCAADRDGNLVGLIQSIFHPFGSGYQEPSTGILLNNRACGFSLDARHVNSLAPGWRSVHTLNSYLIYRDGRPWIVAGTPGGDNQVQTNLQVIRHWVAGDCTWRGPMPQGPSSWSQARPPRRIERKSELERLAAALAAPRWNVERSGRVRVESRLPTDYRKHLERRGHLVARVGPWDGSGLVQAIMIPHELGATPAAGAGPRLGDRSTRVYFGATDPRGEGVALGV